MKIVLDTNVIVAGLLTPFGTCGEVMRMVSSGELKLCFDARIISEYAEVLHRPKFQLDENKVTALLDGIAVQGIIVASSPLGRALPDRDDEPFLEVALAGQAACLVTGNPRHFPPSHCQEMTVFSPSEFLAFYKKKRGRKSGG